MVYRLCDDEIEYIRTHILRTDALLGFKTERKRFFGVSRRLHKKGMLLYDLSHTEMLSEEYRKLFGAWTSMIYSISFVDTDKTILFNGDAIMCICIEKDEVCISKKPFSSNSLKKIIDTYFGLKKQSIFSDSCLFQYVLDASEFEAYASGLGASAYIINKDTGVSKQYVLKYFDKIPKMEKSIVLTDHVREQRMIISIYGCPEGKYIYKRMLAKDRRDERIVIGIYDDASYFDEILKFGDADASEYSCSGIKQATAV